MQLILNDALMGLAGGLLIGASAALLLLLQGRIAGISGIAAGVLRGLPDAGTLAFLAGLIGAPMLYAAFAGAPEIGVNPNLGLLIGAGLLVGIGTRMGSGCTSGHGVCGMSRFSLRSIVATLTFMAVAMIVASFVMPVLGG